MQTLLPSKRQKDLTGNVFGRWRVLGFHHSVSTTYYWLCKCECGTRKPVLYSALVSGASRSCGCLHNEQLREYWKARGKLRSEFPRENRIWVSMRNRCQNPKNYQYEDYGARGIAVDPAWDSFETFIGDMGPCPPGGTIERLDNALGYSKANCVWADRFTQGANKRNNVRFTWKGEEMIMTDLCRQENVDLCSFRNRVFIYDLTPEEAVSYCKGRGLTFKERSRNHKF